jgi:hypothetical protein
VVRETLDSLAECKPDAEFRANGLGEVTHLIRQAFDSGAER